MAMDHPTDKDAFPFNCQWIDFSFIREQLRDKQNHASIDEDRKYNVSTHHDRLSFAELLLDMVAKPNELLFNRWFDVKAYERLRPDVALAEVNSTYHYFSTGHLESGLLGYDRLPEERIEEIRIKEEVGRQIFSPVQISHHWKTNHKTKRPLSISMLLKLIEQLHPNALEFVVSLSHDNPYENSGGIQKIIRDETIYATQNKIIYIHVCPIQPLPFAANLITTWQARKLVVSINGVKLGLICESALFLLTQTLNEKKLRIYIHHLFGFNTVHLISSIIKSSRLGNALFWMHDYSTSCVSYTLLRNKLEFCGSPSPGISEIGECNFCEFAPARASNNKAFASIAHIPGLKFVYPSEACRTTERLGFSVVPSSSDFVIQPHALITDYKIQKHEVQFSHRKCRIAFLGMPARHKGWDEFAALATDPYLSCYFEWFYIGKGNPNLPITSLKVDGIKDLSMEEQIKRAEIDVAFVWPIWPETFCFIAYEAVTSGCHVFTSSISGNVAISLPKQACTVYKSLNDLHQTLVQAAKAGFISIDRLSDCAINYSNYSFSVSSHAKN